MKTIKEKIIPLTALAAALICGVVRFFQIISLTEFETGFFYRGAEFGGLLIYILLAAAGIALFVTAHLGGKKRSEPAFSLSSDGMGKNATRFLGASEIVGGFLIATALFSDRVLIDKCVTVAVGVIYLLSGFVLTGRIIPPAFTGHIKLAATVCLYVRTAYCFDADLVAYNHAEHLIVLLGYVAFTAFTGFLARFYARLETPGNRTNEILFAAITFLLSGTHVISDLLAMAFGGAGASGFVSLNTDMCAAAVISGTFLAVVFLTSKTKDFEPLPEE